MRVTYQIIQMIDKRPKKQRVETKREETRLEPTSVLKDAHSMTDRILQGSHRRTETRRRGEENHKQKQQSNTRHRLRILGILCDQ
jgi:hypothetical protein